MVVMNTTTISQSAHFRVSVLKPISSGRARVLESWVTDGDGAVDALENASRSDLAVQIELEHWDEGLSPAPWVAGTWGSARAQLMQ